MRKRLCLNAGRASGVCTGRKVHTLHFRNTRNLAFFLRKDEGMIDSIAELPVTASVQVCLIRVQLSPVVRRRAGLMSPVVGYCARNKRYRKPSLGLDEAVAFTRRMPLPACLPACPPIPAYLLACLPACLNHLATHLYLCVRGANGLGETPTLALFMSIILETVSVALPGASRFTGHRDGYWSLDP